jgi:uncharacterized protein YndB with AHSA1/START domain
MTLDDTTFRTSRDFPFAPAAIYAAFESPQQLAAWWGPAGFANTFERFDFREGGEWQFVMQGPDGTRYPNRSVFKALEPARTVVIRHDCAPYFTLTVSLAATDGGTRVTWSQAFDDPNVAKAVRHVVVPANEENLDRLGRVLAQGSVR